MIPLVLWQIRSCNTESAQMAKSDCICSRLWSSLAYYFVLFRLNCRRECTVNDFQAVLMLAPVCVSRVLPLQSSHRASDFPKKEIPGDRTEVPFRILTAILKETPESLKTRPTSG